MTRLIVAGSRDIDDYSFVRGAIESSPFDPSEIISGDARGVDSLGLDYAISEGIPSQTFEADWSEHGRSAGPRRNNQMADNADALVAVWDGESRGTRHMIETALKRRMPVHIHPVGYTGIIKNSLTEAELLRRLPEIKRIDDVWIRSVTIESLLAGSPPYIWEIPASGSGKFHPPDERGKHGQWLHVKRMFYAYEEMSESLVQADEISVRERELGKAAVFFHDLMKNGIPPTTQSTASNYHDTLAAEYVRNFTELPEPVARLCDIHNGPWCNDTVPETPFEWVFHEADMLASRNYVNLGVYEPADEIREISDQLIVAE